MEALPNMPMMAPQFRTSTLSYDNIPDFNFRLRVKEFILLTFQADPHEYDEAFDELAQLKFEANIPSASVEQICKLKRYYGQLCMMQKRFPMGNGEQLETPFAWHDGLVDMRSAHSEVTIHDIEFEKASVMFNIGACHAQYAAEQPRDTQDSIKAAFMHFQYAAFAFEQLNTFRNSEIFYPSVDLDANVISFYYKVLIAQAQECLVQKSLLDNRSAILTAKLSMWLHETFESAARIVDEWTVNIPESVQKYYAKLCRLKSDIYGVITFMSLGDHAEKEEKKMGWRLQYYNIAAKFMESVVMDRKMKERYPELLVTASFLFDVITAKQKNAEKENDFIYHDRVPKQEEALDAARKDGAMCKVKTLSFDPLDSSVCGEDLFGSLLPSSVVDANNKYEAEKLAIYKEYSQKAQEVSRLLTIELERAEFDKLRFMLNDGKSVEMRFGMPEELMKRNADMTAYPDCIPNLLEKLRESSETARVAEAKLNTLIAKLRAIDLPRLKTDEGFILISKELDKLAEHLSLAKANNVSLNKAVASHTSNLQMLSLPCREMWLKLIPEDDGVDSQTISNEERAVRAMVDKVIEMQTQRQRLLEQLADELNGDDISKKLMGTNEQSAHDIMIEEIKKFTATTKLIEMNFAAQPNILRAFADANADFCDERMRMQKGKDEYDRKVCELIGSYEVFKDVKQKTEEEGQFYRQLMARCDQFAIPVHAMEEQYRGEIEKKERAQKEAEQHMTQLRMNREAQSALMDFGGPRGPPGMMGPPVGPVGNRAPRLGDYLDSYRARKQNPLQISQQDPHQHEDHPGGPPSPTPSSICDFPMSSSSRSQRMMPSPRAPGAGFPPQQHFQPPPPQGYQAPYFPGGTPQGPYPGSQQAPSPSPSIGSISAPTPVAPFQPAPYGPGHGVPPAPAQVQSYPSYPQPVPGQFNGYQQAPPTTMAPIDPTAHPSYQPPHAAHATHTFQHPPQGAPISAPAPAAQQSHQHVPPHPQAQNFQSYPAPVVPQYGGSSQGFPAQGLSAPAPQQHQQNFQGFNQVPSQVAAPAPQFRPPQGHSPNFQQAPAPQAPVPTVQQGYQQTQQQFQAPAQASAAALQQIAPTPQAFQPQQQNYNFQGFNSAPFAPVAPVPSPATQQVAQNPTSVSTPSPQPPAPQQQPQQQQQPSSQDFNQSLPSAAPSTAPPRFQPTPGAPSPWHATPAELKTPWNTTPQYQAAPPPPNQPTVTPVPAQAARSNVDLLSDLLGDFNLAPPIQPTIQNSQNLQSHPPTRPDFRTAPLHPDPGRVRPAAAVPPMPQQPPVQEKRLIETPILVKGSTSVQDVADPTKFQLGEGNAQKLEKRMLHHSIRTNGAPPPLDPIDPLNQIDAFHGFAPPKR